MATYAVIMAGGSGTRFWPASRADRPKQLLALAGSSGEPLLAATVRRLAKLIPPERVYVVTGERLYEATRLAVPEVPGSQILREPAPRNTAPCIAWATSALLARDPEATLAVLPSDHFIEDEEGFRGVLARALESAESGRVTAVGIVPTRPETGFGYIELGEPLAPGVQGVARFVEKPDRARAEAYVSGGRHLWNAGMFFFRARVMQALVEAHLPGVAAGIRSMTERLALGDSSALGEVFPTLQSVSIAHGVMERAEGLAVVPGRFGWNDVGSWQSAWELSPRDDAQNALPDGAIAVDSSGNLFRVLGSGVKKQVALVGVHDLVVVETDDALLIVPRERAQDVRLVVEELKKSGRAHLL